MADTLLGNLVWKITGDTKDFDKKIDSSEKKTTGFSSKAIVAAGLIGTATIATLAKIVSFVKGSIAVSVQAQEQISKYGVVFDGMGSLAEDAAKKFADSFDLAGSSAKQMLSNTGNLLQGMGATREESLKLSLEVNTLAGDLASFTNNEGGAKAASEALTKALLGEKESMKTLGIAILDSDVNLRVAKNGQSEFTGTALKMAKAQATLELITEQSKNAIGDYARTQDSAANSQKRAEESTIKLQVAIGKALNPAIILSANLWDRIAGSLSDVITKQGELKEVNIDVANGAKTTSTDIGVLSEQYKKLAIDAEALRQSGREETDLYKRIKSQMDYIEGEKLRLKYTAENKKAQLDAINIINAANEKLEKTRLANNEKVNLYLVDERSEYKKLEDAIKQLEGIKTLSGEDEKNRLLAIKQLKDQQQEITKNQINDLDEMFKASGKKRYDDLVKEQKDKQDAKDKELADAKDLQDKKIALINKYATTATSLMSALGGLSAALAAQEIAQLDIQMQKELEAAGVADLTKTESAQLALDKLDENATAEERTAAENAVKKAKIEEKYAKKKAELEYNAAVIQWNLQMALATASAAQAIMVAAAGSPFPLNLPAIGFAGTIGALQLAAIGAAKPVPSFESGGIVPGNSMSGDNVPANVNSREMILTQTQQKTLFDLANGSGGGKPITINLQTILDGKVVAVSSAKYYNNGQVALN